MSAQHYVNHTILLFRTHNTKLSISKVKHAFKDYKYVAQKRKYSFKSKKKVLKKRLELDAKLSLQGLSLPDNNVAVQTSCGEGSDSIRSTSDSSDAANEILLAHNVTLYGLTFELT